MTFDSDVHHRRSIRLRHYDYASTGAYFVTVCAQGRECLFGGITNGEMEMNEAGRMVRSVWQELPDHYPGVEIDIFAVMPNHFHGIVLLVEAGPQIHEKADTGRFVVGAAPRGCPVFGKTQKEREQHTEGHPQGGAPTTLSLPDIVHRFKSLSTARYRQGVKTQGWQPFPGRLW